MADQLTGNAEKREGRVGGGNGRWVSVGHGCRAVARAFGRRGRHSTSLKRLEIPPAFQIAPHPPLDTGGYWLPSASSEQASATSVSHTPVLCWVPRVLRLPVWERNSSRDLRALVGGGAGRRIS